MKIKQYSKYKSCNGDWIEQIPVSWKLIRTKFLFKINKEITGDYGHEVLSITQNGIKLKDVESGGGQLSMDYSKYQLVKVGDFAMNHMDLLTGYVDISNYDGVTSPDYRVFRCIAPECDTRFYLYIFQMGYKNKIFFKYGQGSSHLGRWRLPTDEFNNFLIPEPSNDEKRKIVDFLDRETLKIDVLIEKQEQLIKLLQEKRQAVVSHAVIVEDEDKSAKLSHYLDFLSGYAFSSSDFSLDSDDVRLLRGVNIGVGKIRWQEVVYWPRDRISGFREYELIEGDIVFGMDRPWISAGTRVAKIGNEDLPCLLVQRVARLRAVKGLSQVYLYHILASNEFKSYIESDLTGVSVPHISPEQIKSFRLKVIPEDEQMKICGDLQTKLNKIDRIIQMSYTSIKLMKERRTALISAAVTGKIDVRKVA